MHCRICASTCLDTFLDLGHQPLANALLRASDLEARPEPRFPLALAICEQCALVQLTYVVPGEVLFRHYYYSSSVSEVMTRHFAVYADEVARRFVPEGGLVVEVGSNDGVLLQSLVGRPLRILGVDPARNLAEVAERRGVPTVADFFSEDVAKQIRSIHGRASAVIANNVFAHINDLTSVARGLDELLAEDGVFVFEVPYLVDLVEKLEFDTVYHEHLSYFSVRPLVALFEMFGFEIFEIRRQLVHGGSIRGFVRRKRVRPSDVSPSSTQPFLELEERAGVSDAPRLAAFAAQVSELCSSLRMTLIRLRADGRRIAGYGASAKGTVLLNACDLGRSELEFIVDSTPAKQGLFAPGSHLPIRHPDALRSESIDYALLLAWNHRHEIIDKERLYRDAGGRFIVPLPKVEIV
jgi:SAM-dependent methyltransferase